MDELLHWIEIRVMSSLRPRADDMKALLLDPSYRNNLYEFLKNEDIHTLYIYFKLTNTSLAASLNPPSTLQSKCLSFVKLTSAIKLTIENIGSQVLSVDCTKFPLKYFDMVLHQVFLPLFSNDSIAAGSHSNDKLIEILHRFTGNLEVIAGYTEGSIVLPIPSTELLKSTLFNKQGVAIHIMETTVISWIRQIKVVLKHDPLVEIRFKGVFAGIYHEKEMWEVQICNLESIKSQLDSAEAKGIVCHLEQAKSMYGKSIVSVTQDVRKAHYEATENLMFLETLNHCYDQLKSASSTAEKKKYFVLILHSLYLVWVHSRYYHQPKVFVNLLRLMSNEVSEMARCLLGINILVSPQAYILLKEALKVCATFRGNYLDVKIKADELNEKKMEEIASLNKNQKSSEAACNITMYEVPTPWVYGGDQFANDKKLEDQDSIWIDSPWPLHNAPCFQNMNMFMERCKDVLDVVETIKHFEALNDVALIGGAGTPSSDAMVQEIWSSYCQAKESFMNQVTDVLTAGKNSTFQKAFFDFRTMIKSLEHQLGNILRNSLDQCPSLASKLRLLEVFEGVSKRNVVKDHLKDKDYHLRNMFLEELGQVKDMFQAMESNPPLHVNMTPTVSKLLWIKGLRARISDPMLKLRTVSPLTLEGDQGWELRHLYTELSEELERFENTLMISWLSAVNKELSDSLKLTLLKSSTSSHDPMEYLCTIEINLNSDMLVFLREAEYFVKPPFTLKLPESVGSLFSHINNNRFKVLYIRLEMIASKYNEVIKTMSYHQRALFEKKLLKISEILRDGMNVFRWNMDESMDYTELAISYICTDLYNNFSIVTNNYKSIIEITAAWCTAKLDIFSCRESQRSYSITELLSEQKKIEHELETLLVSDGQKIHNLVQQSFAACGISEASPAWQEFIMHLDAVVLQGLKKVTISSLAALLNALLDHHNVPALIIDVELINGEVAFNPPLDKSTSDVSVMENVEEWLKIFLLRGSHVQGLSSTVKGGYQEYVSEDDDALELVGHILQQVENGVIECEGFLEGLNRYSYLWKKDVHAEFQDFLHRKERINPFPRQEYGKELPLINTNNSTSMNSHHSPLMAAERAFILPTLTAMTNGPLLEDFDSEISTYKDARDSIQRLPNHQQCQWIQVDFRPIKQVLSAYAIRWMWTFTKYLIDQATATLKNLDSFLRRTEPQIESITGEERDTGSFMKMMRLFNEVSSKHVEMEVQFTVLQKTVTLLRKHEMSLPVESDVLYRTMPACWNGMKTKVSLAKQRLGPRIQQEADIVTRDLEQFQHKLTVLGSDIETSEVYKYECTPQEALRIIHNFNTRVENLHNEAKDLKELQELLETTVVDFSILSNCEDLLQKLSLVWQHVDSILKEQDIWKKESWQTMNTDELYDRTRKHLIILQSIPEEVQEWDVYQKAMEIVNIMHMTLPLIKDLSNPAMSTRHWNQLVRQTGGMLRVTADSLKTMTLGDLLAMDLQKHTEDVRTTVQRAMRDVTTERALKNCEEVWLSKIFDLRPHSRVLSPRAENEELASSISGSYYTKGDMNRNLTTGKGSRRLSKQSDRGFHLSKKAGRGSTVSLYESLKHIEEFGKVQLMRNTDSIFEELEHHQLVLMSIEPYAEAGSFLDDVTKWQKKLQVIEIIVHLWLSVQEKWTQMEEVFSTLAFRIDMPREANLFADVNHHFCWLMKSVEENPNILQNCTRRGLQSMLEMLNYKLESCQRAVRLHLERKQQAFPRLFFLSLEDTLNIVCYGYDLEVISGYIMKIFKHVQGLIYKMNSQEDCHKILGVRSFLGEELYLTKPLECSGPVENWLPQLVNSIKESLQHHLWAAMENSNVVITRRKEIHSAGARRVVINKTVSKEEAAEEKTSTLTFSEMSTYPKEESLSIKSGGAESQESEHWVLNTLSDVVYLRTQIKFCEEYDGCKEHSKYTACLKILTEGIEHAAKILNEIPQKDIRLHSERTSKAERKGNGQIGDMNLEKEQEDNLVAFKHSRDVLNLTNYILLLLYQRDVMKAVHSGTTSVWKQSPALRYERDDNTKAIIVKIGDSELHYGYEYQGSAEHIFITPITERIFLSVIGAVSAGIDAMCIGPQASGKKSTIQELALAVGKPLYSFNCTKTSDHNILKDICKGLASSGAWVCMNRIEQLTEKNVTLLAQFLGLIQSARHFGKETVTLQLEEIPLNPAGTCIAILNRMSTNNFSNSYKLPDNLLNCFRMVGVGEFPARFILEAKLLLKGFSNVAELAQKLCVIMGSFAKLYNADLMGFVSSVNGKTLGLSVPEFNNLLNEASQTLKYLCKCHMESQGKELENMQEWKHTLEDRAVVIAIQNSWLSQLPNIEANALRSIIGTEWPKLLNFLNGSCNTAMFNETDGPIPAVIAGKYGPGQQVPSYECTEETSVPSAIIKAAEKCHIFPNNTFVSKVSHLVQLAQKYQTIAVTGPAGCGKTTCIKGFMETLLMQGNIVKADTVYPKTLQSGHLLGFMNRSNGWNDGLLLPLLRAYCKPCAISDNKQMNILHMDGEMNGPEMEIIQNLFCGEKFFIAANNERIRISDSLLVFWELESLAYVSPSVLCSVGILALTSDDIDLKLPLIIWMKSHAEDRQSLLLQLTETYLEPSLQFLRNHKIFYQPKSESNRTQRDVFLCETSVLQTFCRISEAFAQQVPDMLNEDLWKYFIFSCIWCFGGWLDSNERTLFSNWWRQTFQSYTTFPADGEVWDYHIDTDTRHFVRWHDTLSSYSVSLGQSVACEAIVRTVHNEQLLYISSLLITSGCPVLFAGDSGCGKSTLSQELLNCLCLGDVAEMSELRIPINSSTDPRRLWGCLKDRLEWRHGTLHTPTGNKKLLCLLDDLNLAKVNKPGYQPACEFVRQLLDQKRIFDPTTLNWKTIEGIIYLATWNTAKADSSPEQRRLLRHFCSFYCKYPSQSKQLGIFSSILNAHFVPGVTEHKAAGTGAVPTKHLQEIILAITKVSIELQERLRTAFLGTSQRCHYIFTLRELAKIFRNICLSLDVNTTNVKLLRLWRNECDWVYGHRMSSAVDYNRYVQELTIAVQKVFINEEEAQLILSTQQPLFTNIVEDEGGLITTVARQQDTNLLKRSEKASSVNHVLDGYQETFDLVHVKQLLTEALREYNKVNPRLSITFYQCSINLVCRMARNLSSSQGSAHTLLCGEGCPRYSPELARLAGHLSGFTVVHTLGSHAKMEDKEQRSRMLESQLVDCYIKAGLKGNKTLLLLTEEQIDSTALVYLAEFVGSGFVSHLFTLEQQAKIINAMRSEVTNAGLTYSKENAWNLFLQSVQLNIRWLLIRSDTGSTFYKWCTEFSSLFNALNVYYVPKWSREDLVEHASYHFQDLHMLTKQEIENVCHLLSSMHLSIIEHAKSTNQNYGNITNANFEKFVQCFSVLLQDQYVIIKKEHEMAKETLSHIDKMVTTHEKLTDDLTHEKNVLEQHKEGALKILQQIAMDKAVMEQKIQVVHQQLKKIKRFRSLLPEYQVALEKAQYKCSAILKDINGLVQNMDIAALGELRAIQKPDVDVEEMMASIIIILKSPNTDLTWAKGAKRQMANIDRFLNELSSFHVSQLSQSTLELLEASTKKTQFTPENMERKAAGNAAAGSLTRWLQGAVQYYRILTSKVNPLKSKVSEMTSALEEAEQKMSTLQQRKKTLLLRLADLERGFEEATMHKNKQQQRTIEIAQRLDETAKIAELLDEENKKYTAIVSSLPDRLSGIPGSTAMAAGLVSYLGTYEHHFRQLMLTVEWPMAVKERGFPLIIDSIDPDKGRVIEFSVIYPCGSSVDHPKSSSSYEEDDEGKHNISMENSNNHAGQEETSGNELLLHRQCSPIITDELYMDFIKALLLRIVQADDDIQKWSAKDWTSQQMENAAILYFSWQRPVLLIDPCFSAEMWVQEVLGISPGKPFSFINLQARQGSNVLAPIEKKISSGDPLILGNYCSKWDDLIMPLIDHCYAANNKNSQQGSSSIISFNGHRLLCADDFKLYLAACELEPHLNRDMNSGTTIINYNCSQGGLLELLIRKVFAKLQPNLFDQFVKMENIILNHQHRLRELEKKIQECLLSSDVSSVHGDVDIIALFKEKKNISEEFERAKSYHNDLRQKRDELYPLARRGALCYSILKSLRSLADEYYFTLDFFLKLFDSTIETSRDLFQGKSDLINEDTPLAAPHLRDFKTDGQGFETVTESEDVKHSEGGVPMFTDQPPIKHVYPHDSSMSAVRISKIMDLLTKVICKTMIQSLLPEHCIQTCALLFFYTEHMENKDIIREEELAFFSKGGHAVNKTTWGNFTTNMIPPSWLPSETLEELITLSANSVTTQTAENSSEWEKSNKKDFTDIEMSGETKAAEKSIFQRPACGDVGSQWDDFRYLLVIRAACQDRFPDALCRYVEKLLNDLEFPDLCLGVNNIAILEENTFGVLVLEPSNRTNAFSPGGAIMRCKAKEAICHAAKEKSIPLFTVSMTNGNEEEVKAALNDTMNHNGWLIIENIHLASKATLKNLSESLKYAAKMQVSQKDEGQFCVWLTTETGASIPQDFLAHLKKVSWHFLLLNQMDRKPLMTDVIYIDSLPRVLFSAILSALDEMQEETCNRMKMSPVIIQRLCYAVCLLHGFLQTQRIYPKTGLKHLLGMSPMQLHQALNKVLSTYEKMKNSDKNFINAVMEEVNSVYACLALTLDDTAYIQAVVYEILSCSLKEQEFVVINCLRIPIPSVEVDPAQYCSWLIDHMPTKESLLAKTSEGAADDTAASHFMQDLSAMYDAVRSSLPSNILEDHYSVKQLADLRAVIDTVLEQLPPLIQIDVIDKSLKEGVSTYHGTSSEETSRLVLLQECSWMNINLKHIKSTVSVLSRCLLGGVTAIPENLRDAAEALLKVEVPKLWLPLHSCQMSINIVPWLEGLHRQHGQLKQWAKKGLIPFAKGEKEALTSINLGGLVNPEALLLALKVEFALHYGYLLHEVVLQCHIVESPDCKPARELYQLCLTGLVLQRAAWDFKSNLLKESRNRIYMLQYVIITPVYLGNIKPSEDGTGIYDCPVYMDHTMQNCVMRIPIPCTQPVRQWHLKRVAMFVNLDLGISAAGSSALTMKQSKPVTNSLTKVDKSSHSRISSRPSMDKNCLLSQAQEQEKFRQTGMFSTDNTTKHDLMIDRTEQSKEPEKNSKIGVANEQKLMVYGKIADSNPGYKKLIGVDVRDGHQIGSVPGTKEDNADRNIALAEETGFMESNTKA